MKAHKIPKTTFMTSLALDLFTLVRQRKWDHVIERARLFPEESSVSFSLTFNNGVTISTLPIHIACAHNAPVRVILTLLSSDPYTCEITDGIGRTPLHNAMRYGSDIKLVRVLMAIGPKAVYVKAGDGSLPIHYACRYATSLADHIPMIKHLLWAHPDSMTEVDVSGYLPRDWAFNNPNPAIQTEIINLLDSFEAELGTGLDARNDSAGFRTTTIGNISRINEGNSFTQTIQSNSLESNSSEKLVLKNDKKNISTTKKCVICIDRNVSKVLIPCGHPCLCDKCSSIETMNQIKWKCPECRADIEQVVTFFGRIAIDA